MLRKGLVILLAVVIMGGSAVAFAWWDRLTVSNAEENIITIGQGLELVVEDVVIDPVSAGNLVPASAVLKTGDVTQVVLTYTVKFDVSIEEELDLAVNVTGILVDGVANPYGLINIAVVNPGTIQNQDVVVTLTVTIDDSLLAPEDYEAAYLAVANKTISFNVTFAATRQ